MDFYEGNLVIAAGMSFMYFQHIQLVLLNLFPFCWFSPCLIVVQQLSKVVVPMYMKWV